MSIKFYKISLEQYIKDRSALSGKPDTFASREYLRDEYENIIMPCRATAGSAGYDFHIPFDGIIRAGESVIIPTGIRCLMNKAYVLMLYPRSGLGFKYEMRLANTIGVIDSDYSHSENEGHILIKVHNPSDKDIVLKRGARFAQGVFTRYYLTDDDGVLTERTGGIGSTG